MRVRVLLQVFDSKSLTNPVSAEQHQESVKVAEFFEKQREEDPDIQKVKALAYKPPNLITQTDIEAIKSMSNILKYRCDLCNVNCNAPQMLALVSNLLNRYLAES